MVAAGRPGIVVLAVSETRCGAVVPVCPTLRDWMLAGIQQQTAPASSQAANSQQQPQFGAADPGEVEKYPEPPAECHTMEFAE